ncbi:DNA cytosine methyltransferase [Brevundimonas sp. A19_0]|nr:DNA cytosine methyltransferase [Brevundimonas sp. A19_0]
MALHTDRIHDLELRGLSLCAGYGGLDLGLHIAEPGYRTVGYVERETHAAAALVARMADQALAPAPIWSDLRSFDGRPWRGRVHIVSAGYPCQPFSLAGKRRGDQDPRHLWPDVARIVDEVRPRFVFLENVEGHVSLGLGDVARDLRGLGYGVKAGLFTAAEAGAPHVRKRLFILADAHGVAGGLLPGHGDRGRDPDLHGAVRCEAGQRGPVQPGQCGPGLDDASRDPVVDRGAADGAEVLFAPRPGELEAWERLLARRPDLEPALPRDGDGVADRMDRARGAGNGVCSMAAALAWRTLRAAG